MRKKIILVGTLLTVMASGLAGCNKSSDIEKTGNQNSSVSIENSTESAAPNNELPSENKEASRSTEADTMNDSKADYEKVYASVLEHYCDVISNGIENYEAQDGEYGLFEMLRGSGAESINNIGYHIEDINGDDVPELIIGEKLDFENYNNQILSVYTCIDGEPAFVLDSWSRNRYYLLDDNTLYNEGSSGALYSIFANYALKQNDTALDCKDYYFTYEKNTGSSDIGFYHNTSGEWDKAVSEELNVSAEEFFGISADYQDRIKTIDYISLSDFKK